MLRSRSRAVLGKQALVADHHRSQPSPTQNPKTKVPSFLGSSFRGFLSTFCSEYRPMLSPSLGLDLKPFSSLRTHSPTKFPGKKHSWEDFESRGIGLAIVDKLFDKMPERNYHKLSSNMIFSGSSLKVQIPSLPPHSLMSSHESPKSPTDFGTKTRNSQLQATFGTPGSCFQTENPNSPRLLTECLSVSEMELSEDYTRVIYHGPNPRTTHIFENCVVGSYCSVLPKPLPNPKPKPKPGSFLSLCYTCKKSLEETKDIFMYRGEKAFCSHECRHHEIMLDGAEFADQAVDSSRAYS